MGIFSVARAKVTAARGGCILVASPDGRDVSSAKTVVGNVLLVRTI